MGSADFLQAVFRVGFRVFRFLREAGRSCVHKGSLSELNKL